MPTFLVSFILTWAAHAEGEWTLLHSGAHPNCTPPQFSFTTAGDRFSVQMKTEAKAGVTYLRSVKIQGAKGGQTIETPAVTGVEGEPCFQVYRLSFGSRGGVLDLAIRAYNSANAGPSYIYLIYDGPLKKFVPSDSTIPKLNWDPKTRQYLTEVQGVPFALRGSQFREL